MSLYKHLESNPTTPIENILKDMDSRYMAEYRKLVQSIRSTGLRLVDFHVSRLGKPKGTFTSEYRFSIWEGAGWRVFVSNTKGVCFEVNLTSTPKEAIKAWDDYRHSLR